jgi:serine/threonine-protein kinase
MGGMAELYLAQQSGAAGFSKLVALKRILPHLAHEETFTRMFLSEARLASDLSHPNLAHVLDFGEADGEHFLTMEYIHGANLLDALKRARGPLPLAAALQLVVDVARGAHELHEHRSPEGRPLGLVHRDISPSNVLLAYDGSVKLTDFGIAKAMELTSATRTGTFKGKLGHSSPEQARGEPVDRRSDVFCLGILLYEVTTGARAFSGPNEFAVLGKVARAAYEPPAEIVEGYPADLAVLVARALAPAPEDRPPTAAAFAEAITAFARTHDVAMSPQRVGAMMRDLFGEPPPITDAEEMERISTVVPALGAKPDAKGSAARPWLAYALVPLALVLGAAGAWNLRAPADARTARTALADLTIPDMPEPREPSPIAVAQVEPEPESDPEAAASPKPQPETPRPRRKRQPKSRKKKPRKAEDAPKKGIDLSGALFPPEP